jgi:hypothetical protein
MTLDSLDSALHRDISQYPGHTQVQARLGPVGFGVDFVLLVDLGWAQYMA